MKDFTILIGGQAGQGSRKAGLVIAKILNNLGYRIFIYDDYQSLVKGGHSFSKIRASNKKVFTQNREVDFILALDQLTIDKHIDSLKENGLVVFNSSKVKFSSGIPIDAETIAKEEGGMPIMAKHCYCFCFC